MKTKQPPCKLRGISLPQDLDAMVQGRLAELYHKVKGFSHYIQLLIDADIQGRTHLKPHSASDGDLVPLAPDKPTGAGCAGNEGEFRTMFDFFSSLRQRKANERQKRDGGIYGRKYFKRPHGDQTSNNAISGCRKSRNSVPRPNAIHRVFPRRSRRDGSIRLKWLKRSFRH